GANGTTLDMVAAGGTLKFLPTGETVAVVPSPAQMKVIADNGGWVPTTMNDYVNLAVGGRMVGLRTFSGILRYLSLVPKGSVQTLNIVGHSPNYLTLAFERDFQFSELTGVTTIGPPDPDA